MGPPAITLPDIDLALAELDWCLEHGARTVLLRPAPVPQPDGSSISMGAPQFDPFWRRCEEAGIAVMMHNADSGYDRYATDWEPGRDEFQGFDQTVFRMFLYEENRHIFDTLCALVAHGVFQRFPRTRVGVVENGGGWVPRLVETFDHVYDKMPDRFDEHPSDVLRRHVWINPFHEDDMTNLVDCLGADRVLFGSDFRTPRASPNRSSSRNNSPVSPTTTSARSCAFRPAAERYGPTVAEIAQPLVDLPEHANEALLRSARELAKAR